MKILRTLSTTLLAAAAFILFTAGSCDDSDTRTDDHRGTVVTSGDSWAYLVNEDRHESRVNGNTLTYGSHTYTVRGDIDFNASNFSTPTAWVEFTNIPSGATEFRAVYEGLLGRTAFGAAAMVPMAMEIYARDAATGEECFRIFAQDEAVVTGIIRILKTKFNASKYSPEDDAYIQRYLPAATLKGASRDNAYTPDEPYTVELCCSSTRPQQVSITADGTMYYVNIIAQGWDSVQRGITLFQSWDEGLFKLNACASAYTQCKNIRGTWEGLK